MNQSKPLVLVDGSSYLYRAFHAMPALSNSKGKPTGAVYGVVNMLKRLLADIGPTHMAVVFDTKGETFRDKLSATYKATRKQMPSELAEQIEPLFSIIRAMGLPLIMVEGVEADDVIGTLAKRAEQAGIKTLISTGDKDLAQLVNAHITLINTMTNTLLDPEGVRTKFGVRPEGIIDYLTLVGDSSDNIQGVPQVGPKTAMKWLQEYGSLENIIAHKDEIKGRAGDHLRGFIQQIPLTRSLVTIKLDVDLPLHANDLCIQNSDQKTLTSLFKEMEFKNWLSNVLDESREHREEKYKNYATILTLEQLKTWMNKLQQVTLFAFDTETTSLDYMQAKIVGVSFAIAQGDAAYLPFGHDQQGEPAQLSKDLVLATLKPLLENPQIYKVGQNIKYDIEVLANEGIQLNGARYDTMLESYVLDSVSSNHNMDALALKYLGWRTITYEEVAGKGSKQIPFNQVPLAQASTYAAEDADVTLALHQVLWPRVQEQAGIKTVFEQIEMPLVTVLARIERNGVLIDPIKLEKQGKELEQRLLTLEQEAYLLAGNTFNINSPKQLQEILFEKLQLPVLQKTPTGQASTADAVLQELALDFPLPKIIIEYRSLSKLISTYTSRLVEQINPETGRIHTSYHQAGTATGRLSSSNPNLQNIPIRMLEGRRIRQAFIAKTGYRMISADYSQIELRLMAHLSKDAGLSQAFLNDLDIHIATAAEVAAVPLADVTAEMRRKAKAVNFGLIYGMSAFGLSKQLGIDQQSAKNYIERYFERYPGVKEYMESTRQQAREHGFVETCFGRRLYLPEIQSSQIMRQKAAERAAINAPLQGSAADIIKLAMIEIDKWLQEEQLDAKMIMQVHDELVFEAAEALVPRMIERIQQLMCSVVSLHVPLKVSVGVGENWDAASAH
jgi:DNA polymerase I